MCFVCSSRSPHNMSVMLVEMDTMSALDSGSDNNNNNKPKITTYRNTFVFKLHANNNHIYIYSLWSFCRYFFSSLAAFPTLTPFAAIVYRKKVLSIVTITIMYINFYSPRHTYRQAFLLRPLVWQNVRMCPCVRYFFWFFVDLLPNINSKGAIFPFSVCVYLSKNSFLVHFIYVEQ